MSEPAGAFGPRAIRALKWMVLFVGVIAATYGYLMICDRYGVGKIGRWVLSLGGIATSVVLIALMVREDLREEDERFKD